MPQNKRFAPLVAGQKFHQLTIVELHHQDKRWRRFYVCMCDCGETKVVQGSLLLSGNTKSCGCFAKETKFARRLPDNQGVINHLILQYKRHAKGRNLDFELNKETFTQLIKQPCHYCGLPPSNNKITKNCKGFLYSGIDRINSSIGYTEENCVPCCAMCNLAKRDLSEHDFLQWIKRVYEHQAMATQWGSLPEGAMNANGQFFLFEKAG